ncbi:ATP-binding protein [Actinomadura sp. 9N407]|uniref:ATP-binding protein n=1 Tax=Actinomadura sp. 9N407 TaxID=3375154 RepID=UPI00379DDF5D
MTSRHAHDDTRWGAASNAGPAGSQDCAVASVAVPESCDLPPRLGMGLRALVAPAGPTVSFTVLPEPESVTEARHFAVSRLDGWGGAVLADDVGLVVSELVTNALRHSGGSPLSRRARRDGRVAGMTADPLGSAPAAIRLRMLYEAPWLLCGIIDSSPAAPRRKEPDYIAETGRGLHLVESFSIRWGWCGLPHGKIVWALFRSS